MRLRKVKILVIDDDDNDRWLIERALKGIGALDIIKGLSSGHEAIRYFKGEGEFSDRTLYPYPNIVLTDLKMTRGDGFEVLAFLKSRPEWKIIPVLVLTGSKDADDVKRSYEMGASCYVHKPSSTEELKLILRLFHDFWLKCETPEIHSDGKQVGTNSEGKLGERFGDLG